MNIFDNLKIGGQWWDPKYPSKKIGGVLEVKPSHSIMLTLFGKIAEHENSYSNVICGLTETGKRISLFGPRSWGRGTVYYGDDESDTVYSERLKFESMLEGCHKHSEDSLLYDHISVEFDCLYEWTELTNYRREESSHSLDKQIIVYGDMKAEKIDIGVLNIEFNVLKEMSWSNTDPKISQRLEVNLSNGSSFTPEFAYKNIGILRGFFRTFIGQEVNVELITLHNTTTKESVRFLSPRTYIRKRKEPFDFNQAFFSYKSLRQNLVNILMKWFRYSKEFPTLFTRYVWYLDASEAVMESRLLAIIQCFEGFHREFERGSYLSSNEYEVLKFEILKNLPKIEDKSLLSKIGTTLDHVNEYSLRKRLSLYIEEQKSFIIFWISDSKDFARRISDWRNIQSHGLTHGDEFPYKEIGIYQLRLEILTAMLLISHIGLPPSAVSQRARSLWKFGKPIML